MRVLTQLCVSSCHKVRRASCGGHGSGFEPGVSDASPATRLVCVRPPALKDCPTLDFSWCSHVYSDQEHKSPQPAPALAKWIAANSQQAKAQLEKAGLRRKATKTSKATAKAPPAKKARRSLNAASQALSVRA